MAWNRIHRRRQRHGTRKMADVFDASDSPETLALLIKQNLEILQQSKMAIVDGKAYESTINLLTAIDEIIKGDAFKELNGLSVWPWIQKLKALKEKHVDYCKMQEHTLVQSNIGYLDTLIEYIENVLLDKLQLQDTETLSVANYVCKNMSAEIPKSLIDLYQEEKISAQHFIFSCHIYLCSLDSENVADLQLLYPEEFALYDAFRLMNACQNDELKTISFRLLKEKKISECTFINTVRIIKVEPDSLEIRVLYKTLEKFDAIVQEADFSEKDKKKIYREVDALINEALQPTENEVEDVGEIQTPVLDNISSKIKAGTKILGSVGHKLGIASMVVGVGLVVLGVLGILVSSISVLSTWGLIAPLAFLGVGGSMGLISAGAALITAGDIGKNSAKKQHEHACEAQSKFNEVSEELKEGVATVRSAVSRILIGKQSASSSSGEPELRNGDDDGTLVHQPPESTPAPTLTSTLEATPQPTPLTSIPQAMLQPISVPTPTSVAPATLQPTLVPTPTSAPLATPLSVVPTSMPLSSSPHAKRSLFLGTPEDSDSSFTSPFTPSGNQSHQPSSSLASPYTPSGNQSHQPSSSLASPYTPSGNQSYQPSSSFASPFTHSGNQSRQPSSSFVSLFTRFGNYLSKADDSSSSFTSPFTPSHQLTSRDSSFSFASPFTPSGKSNSSNSPSFFPFIVELPPTPPTQLTTKGKSPNTTDIGDSSSSGVWLTPTQTQGKR